MTDNTTIFALSTGSPPAAIAIIRVSGPEAAAALEKLVGQRPRPRQAQRVKVVAGSGEAIDDGIALWFPAPHSATGEDVAELHLHGGRAVIARVIEQLGSMPGLRLAEPGEFTRRALENGKLDLTAVEGLHDLIFAETEMQRRQALRQARGLLGEKAAAWRARLIEIAALIEVGIDFSDEGDVSDDLLAPAMQKVADLQAELESVLAASTHSERLREGMTVAIAGPPNVGKSTLLNRLARRDVAIVSPYAGTTRDVIEVHLDLRGYPVTLLDTAGIRATDDPVEQEGIRRAQARAESADLVLWLSDASAGATGEPEPGGISAGGVPVWKIFSKADIAGGRAEQGAASSRDYPAFALGEGQDQGLERLISALAEYAGAFFAAGEGALITRSRHRTLLREAADSLARALGHGFAADELVAEDVRIAARCLERLVGRVDVEDVLDAIFREFCIGK